jgi:hypothetical protein
MKRPAHAQKLREITMADPLLANMTPEEQYVRDTGAPTATLGINIMQCVQGNVLEQIERNGKKLDRVGICLARLEYSADIERDRSPEVSLATRSTAGVLSPFINIAGRRDLSPTIQNAAIILKNVAQQTSHPDVRKQSLIPLVLSLEHPNMQPLNTSCATGWVIGFADTIMQATNNAPNDKTPKKPELTKKDLDSVAKACFFQAPGTSKITVGQGKDAGVDQALHYLQANPNPKKSYWTLTLTNGR